MHASPPIHQAPKRRLRLTRASLAHVPLAHAAAIRLRAALICLSVSYLLAWLELPLAYPLSPAETAAAGAAPLAAAIVARLLLGALYVFVALRHAWARWITVALGFLSAFVVAPMLPDVWRTFELAAVITGAGIACKLAAAVLLMLPMRTRSATR